MKNSLIVNIKTFSDIQNWKIGEQILRPIFSVEKLKPQRVATFGEVTPKHGVNVDELSDCQSHWASIASMRINGSMVEFPTDFNWKRIKVAKSLGTVNFTGKNMKGNAIPGRLYFESQFTKDIDWVDIFSIWCSLCSPYSAILHPAINLEQPILSKGDVRDSSIDEQIIQNAWSQFLSGNLHCEFRAGELNSLISGLTNLGWASFFGGKFATEFDEVAISAAGFPVRKLGEGFLVQVTNDINDVVNDFAMFSKRRAELKSLFREDLFLIKDEPQIY